MSMCSFEKAGLSVSSDSSYIKNCVNENFSKAQICTDSNMLGANVCQFKFILCPTKIMKSKRRRLLVKKTRRTLIDQISG